MSIYGIKALAVTGVAAAVLGGGTLLVGVSSSSSGAGCVAPAPAVSGVATRRVELTQILTPAGSALVSNGSTGLIALRQSLNEALGCEAKQVSPAVSTAVEGVSEPAPSISAKSRMSPNCRIV
ncbi:MAG: hypothetical protein ACRDKG_05970 [Actinomycetota bacterium]